MKLRVLLLICFLALTWTSSAGAQAQRPERPYRGLFRGSAAEDVPDRQLTLNVLGGAGYDDNVLAEVSGGGGPTSARQVAAKFGRMAADLGYSHSSSRLTFGASVASDSRYFPELETEYYGAHSGSIGVSALVGRRTRLEANQAISYQPFLTFDLFPSLSEGGVGVAQAASQDLSTPFEDFTSYRTAVDLAHPVSRRGTLAFSYNHEFSNFTSDVNDLRSQAATGRYTHGLARDLSLRLGYGYTVGEYFDAEEPRTVYGHLLDVGVDYSRALSVSRRTTLSFATGSSVLNDSNDTRYGIIGDVRLNREIGRTWNASMAYIRNTSFVRTFSQPFFSDSVSAEVKGLLNRRVEFVLDGSASFGDVGIDTEANNGYESFAATSLFTVAVTRNLAVTASYGYYKYNFEQGVVLPVGLASDVERQVAQIAIRMWAPLYQSRSSNASR